MADRSEPNRPEIPEMRIGMLDGRWTVAMADMAGWVSAGSWEDLPHSTVADWVEIGPAVDATEFQEELYNRAASAENALADAKQPGDFVPRPTPPGALAWWNCPGCLDEVFWIYDLTVPQVFKERCTKNDVDVQYQLNSISLSS